MLAYNRDLFCIKTMATGTGSVEVFSLTAGSNYRDWYVTAPTPMPMGPHPKWHFLLAENNDLFRVSTGDTGTGVVEVHSLTAGSNYRNWHVTAVTPITFDDAFNYRFRCVRKLVSVGTTAPSRRLNVAVVGYS